MAFEDTKTALAVVASLDAVALTLHDSRRRRTNRRRLPLTCNGSSRSPTLRTVTDGEILSKKWRFALF